MFDCVCVRKKKFIYSYSVHVAGIEKKRVVLISFICMRQLNVERAGGRSAGTGWLVLVSPLPLFLFGVMPALARGTCAAQIKHR